MKNVMICAATTLVVAGGGLTLASGAGAHSDRELTARVVDTSGETVGRVRLSVDDDDDRTEVKVAVELPPSMAGFHGFHIHGIGSCLPKTGPSAFTGAGPHLGEDAADPSHRHRNHEGDMPVLLVNADGHANARFTTDRLDVDDLVKDDGSAVIIHAAPDNYANIPSRYTVPNPVLVYPGTTTDTMTLTTGDSGGRIGCGVIKADHRR